MYVCVSLVFITESALDLPSVTSVAKSRRFSINFDLFNIPNNRDCKRLQLCRNPTLK